MLQKVLQEVEASQGPIRPVDLSKKLGIEPGVLEGMLEFWIRKGRIRREVQGYTGCDQSCCPAGCQLCSLRRAKE